MDKDNIIDLTPVHNEGQNQVTQDMMSPKQGEAPMEPVIRVKSQKKSVKFKKDNI